MPFIMQTLSDEELQFVSGGAEANDHSGGSPWWSFGDITKGVDMNALATGLSLGLLGAAGVAAAPEIATIAAGAAAGTAAQEVMPILVKYGIQWSGNVLRAGGGALFSYGVSQGGK